MNKEQIDLLHPEADFMRGRLCEQKRKAADALEAKAAPVGEREAFEAWAISQGENAKTDGADYYFATTSQLYAGWKAGAAHQRQQPQSAEAEEEDRHEAIKAIHDIMAAVPCASLYSMAEAVLDAGYAPQPSAGVVMPESVGVLILGGIFHGGSGPEFGDIDIEPSMRVLERIQMELVTSSDDVHLELFARLNGKEVGRG